MSFWNPYESRPIKTTSNGEIYYFRLFEQEWELQHIAGDGSEDVASWIRPYVHGEVYTTKAPEWFDNPWPRFSEIITPEVAVQILEMMKRRYESGLFAGAEEIRRSLRNTLGIK